MGKAEDRKLLRKLKDAMIHRERTFMVYNELPIGHRDAIAAMREYDHAVDAEEDAIAAALPMLIRTATKALED